MQPTDFAIRQGRRQNVADLLIEHGFDPKVPYFQHGLNSFRVRTWDSDTRRSRDEQADAECHPSSAGDSLRHLTYLFVKIPSQGSSLSEPVDPRSPPMTSFKRTRTKASLSYPERSLDAGFRNSAFGVGRRVEWLSVDQCVLQALRVEGCYVSRGLLV